MEKELLNNLLLRINLKRLLLILSFFIPSLLQAVAPCDNSNNAQACIGNALTIKVNNGLGAQYVDVKRSTTLDNVSTAMTVEMWLKPNVETGKTQYIAGMWGPSTDKNDVWVIYIDKNDDLVFEINGTTTNLGAIDNTAARTGIGTYNQTWFHLACMFDGTTKTASIYIDGNLKASATNQQYPVSTLRKMENKDLYLQIGSTNAFSNNSQNRTYRGQMDEIRIWDRILNQTELICQKDISLNDTYKNLVLYFRCNEAISIYELCDAANKGSIGYLRSGARCEASDRKDFLPFVVVAPQFPDTVRCATKKVYTFTVTDTSLCGSSGRIRVLDVPQHFTFNSAFVQLYPNQATSFTFSLNTNYVGTLKPRIYIERANRCGQAIFLKQIVIVRETDLKYDVDSLDLGIAKKNCIEEPYKEKTFRLCNNTGKTGTNQTKTITSFKFNRLGMFQVVFPTVLPLDLAPDACVDIRVRFNPALDTANTYYDTLVIVSNDNCSGGGRIPVKGKIEDILRLNNLQTKRSVDSIDFGTICIGYYSNVYLYTYENLSTSPIQMTSIAVPPQFQGSQITFPLTLDVKTSYREKFVRFAPTVAGTYRDSVIFLCKSGSCTIRRVLIVKGRCIDTKVKFNIDTLKFGNVVVGQTKTLSVGATNIGNEQISVSFYLRQGDVFFFNGGQSVSINPGETRTVSIDFRPFSDSNYVDAVCYVENKCYESSCIPVTGKGVNERFLYNPSELRITSVMACGSETGVLEIKNNGGNTENLSNFNLNDPAGKFSMVDPPSLVGYTLNLPPGQSKKFTVRYTPNDILKDRADRAFLDYSTSDNTKWQGKLYGTSALPKIFITELTTYGTIEAGDKKRKVLQFENISSLPITLDSVTISSDFAIVYPLSFAGRLLNPRDTIEVTVDFLPQAPGDFNGIIKAYATKPCTITATGSLTGKAKVIPLEMISTLITYGFVKPCDCEERKLPLVNNSGVFAASIDSIWIDGQGVTDAYPMFFRWSSDFSNGTLPYQIPINSKDTLRIFYCPRSLSLRDSIIHSAKLHIKSNGTGWSVNFDRFLTGKQMLFQEPGPLITNFPPTRVNNFATALTTYLTIPDIDVNPSRDGLQIDSVTFEPEDKVFTATDRLGKPFPIIVAGKDTLRLKIDFKPRAPRAYVNKMKIHFSKPCYTSDTTLTIKGSGFAPAFGMGLTFQDAVKNIDSVVIISCDTLFLPVYTNREIPATSVDIKCRIGYDTSKFEYVGASSYYMNASCMNRTPKISNIFSPTGGKEFILENFCDVDSLKPFMIAKFLAKQRVSVQDTFKVDSIAFDTKEIILYQIIATSDKIFVKTKNSDFKILNDINFDSVRVLDCSDRTFQILNTGEVDILLGALNGIPADVAFLTSVPNLGDIVRPGDTASITLRFCPSKKQVMVDSLLYSILKPCISIDSNNLAGIGFAPILEVRSDLSNNYLVVDTVKTAIGDTIELPLYFEKDLKANYNNIDYWLEDLSFELNFKYRKEALKLIAIKNDLKNLIEYSEVPGGLKVTYKNVDSLRAGRIGSLKFLSVVPDSSINYIETTITNFNTSKIMFLDLVNYPEATILEVEGACNLETVHFGINGKYQFESVYPNPTNNSIEMKFTLVEKVNFKIELFDLTGHLVKVLADYPQEMPFGNYSIKNNLSDVPSGNYLIHFSSPNFINTKPLIIAK